MIDEKKWIFSWSKFFCGIFGIVIDIGTYAGQLVYADDPVLIIMTTVFFLLILCVCLKVFLSYCAYNRSTLFVYSFFKCKEINFRDITFISHRLYKSRKGNSDKWFVSYWDKDKKCEKRICPNFPSGESKKMHEFFAAVKAVHPCKIDCYDYTENYEGVDDILDGWQGDNLDGIAGVSFKGSFYVTFEMKQVRMKDGDLSALKKVLLEDIDFKNSLNEGDEEADENCLGISENDKLELISVDDSMTDIKALGEECRILETMPVCNMVKKADGYYKIFKNGTEYASADVKYRVAKHGSKYVLFYFVFYNDEPQKTAVLRGYPIAY